MFTWQWHNVSALKENKKSNNVFIQGQIQKIRIKILFRLFSDKHFQCLILQKNENITFFRI